VIPPAEPIAPASTPAAASTLAWVIEDISTLPGRGPVGWRLAGAQSRRSEPLGQLRLVLAAVGLSIPNLSTPPETITVVQASAAAKQERSRFSIRYRVGWGRWPSGLVVR
jgi:hypothetical protein